MREPFAFTATQGPVLYVATAQAPHARELLTDAGMPVGVVDEDLLDC